MAGKRKTQRRRIAAWVLVASAAAGVGVWWATSVPEPPLDDIGAESRERLERELRDAEREGAGRP